MQTGPEHTRPDVAGATTALQGQWADIQAQLESLQRLMDLQAERLDAVQRSMAVSRGYLGDLSALVGLDTPSGDAPATGTE